MTTDWLRAGLAKPGKNQAGLAAALRIDPSAISKVLSGRRRLKADEMVAAAAYLDLPPPAGGAARDPASPPDALAELHTMVGALIRLGELDHAVRITETLLARLRSAAGASRAANTSTPGPASGGPAGGSPTPRRDSLKAARN